MKQVKVQRLKIHNIEGKSIKLKVAFIIPLKFSEGKMKVLT